MRQFQALCQCLGIEARDGWARNGDRINDREALDREVGAALAPLSVKEAQISLQAAGVPCP